MQESEFFAFQNAVLNHKFSKNLRSADASGERVRRGESSRAISGLRRKTLFGELLRQPPDGDAYAPGTFPETVASMR
jgi:hypothetical protein